MNNEIRKHREKLRKIHDKVIEDTINELHSIFMKVDKKLEILENGED